MIDPMSTRPFDNLFEGMPNVSDVVLEAHAFIHHLPSNSLDLAFKRALEELSIMLHLSKLIMKGLHQKKNFLLRAPQRKSITLGASGSIRELLALLAAFNGVREPWVALAAFNSPQVTSKERPSAPGCPRTEVTFVAFLCTTDNDKFKILFISVYIQIQM